MKLLSDSEKKEYLYYSLFTIENNNDKPLKELKIYIVTFSAYSVSFILTYNKYFKN